MAAPWPSREVMGESRLRKNAPDRHWSEKARSQHEQECVISDKSGLLTAVRARQRESKDRSFGRTFRIVGCCFLGQFIIHSRAELIMCQMYLFDCGISCCPSDALGLFFMFWMSAIICANICVSLQVYAAIHACGIRVFQARFSDTFFLDRT